MSLSQSEQRAYEKPFRIGVPSDYSMVASLRFREASAIVVSYSYEIILRRCIGDGVSSLLAPNALSIYSSSTPAISWTTPDPL